MRSVVVGIWGLVVVGCGSASENVDAQGSAIKRSEAPYRTDRLPPAKPQMGDYPPVEGNPAGVGTPPFHENSRSSGFKGRPDPFAEKL
ncbi:hypothetical protein EON82_20680 [bacterium]|nr:MAG: hypothetical protein EON82_20680 [bacterium]